jgi:hypothetical protein
VINILFRLDKKLTEGGVDDSNGTVCGFIDEAVEMLKEYVKLDSSCIEALKKTLYSNHLFRLSRRS